MTGPPDGPGGTETVRTVWRWPVRLAHWTLAASVLFCLAVHHGAWHERLGYVALGVALWRVAFGLLTRDGAARFSAFVRGPAATLAYGRALLERRERHHLGHNPLGGWMIVALLALALATAASGALYVTDRFWGVEALEELHEALAWTLAALVPLHLAGVVFTSRRQRENLAAAMLHGRKRVPPGGAVDEAQVGPRAAGRPSR